MSLSSLLCHVWVKSLIELFRSHGEHGICFAFSGRGESLIHHCLDVVPVFHKMSNCILHFWCKVIDRLRYLLRIYWAKRGLRNNFRRLNLLFCLIQIESKGWNSLLRSLAIMTWGALIWGRWYCGTQEWRSSWVLLSLSENTLYSDRHRVIKGVGKIIHQPLWVLLVTKKGVSFKFV